MRDKIRSMFIGRLSYRRDKFVASEAAKIPSGSRVLDVGAGPCKYRRLFSHCEYRAQDFAQHRPTDRGPLAEEKWVYGQLDYVCDAANIPCAAGMFDVVLCTEVLEHVRHPADVLGEICRVLRPGGKIIVTAPLASGLHQDPDHYFGGFTPYFYEWVLGAGFVDIVVTPNGGFFSHHAQETQRFSAWIDPRRLPFLPALVMFPVFLFTLPFLRLIYPLMAEWLDRFDSHKGFTVGYHVTATKAV